MNVGIVYMLISLVVGSLGFTLWNWLWKKVKDSQVEFNKSYIFSMLLSTLASVIVVPFILNGHAVPDNILAFIIISSLAIGFV